MLTFVTNYYMAYMVCVSFLFCISSLVIFSNYPLTKTFTPVDPTQKNFRCKKASQFRFLFLRLEICFFIP